MKSKILLIGLIAIIAIVAVFLVLQKEDIKVHDVDEAFSLLKENYSISNDYSVINITNISNANGWRFEFLKVEGNCSLECIEKHIYFEVYKNGSVIKSENSTNVTKLENENDALNYVLYKFPEFKNISKCEFEEKLMCHEDIIVEKIDNGWNITFMNETKGCNNECVIEHYYSFLVEKDGKIAKRVKREVTVDLEKIFKERFEYGNLSFYSNSPYWWFEDTILTRSFRTVGGIEISSWLPWSGGIVTYQGNESSYISVYNDNEKIVYLSNANSSITTYNILLEKFSTKTINNESDVLEAFKRYLELFGGGGMVISTDKVNKIKQSFVNENGEVPTYKKTYMKRYIKEIESVRTGGAGFEDRLNPKVIKKGHYWLANISVVNYPSCEMVITDYNVILTNRGAVIGLNITNTTSNTFCLPPL